MSSASSPEQLTELLRFAHELADLADDVTLPGFAGAFVPGAAGDGAVDRKPDGTAVTAFDREAERVVRRAVRERFPGHAFLGEEDGLDGDDAAPRWIVDPIDGTTNFVTGNPVWATLVALQIDGEEVVGVVSAPALGTRWDGVRGGPAHQDGRVVRVSPVADLADAQVTFGGLDHFAEKGVAGAVPALTARTRRQRGFGDFWQHCLVAAGTCEVAVEAEVNLWDLAAVKVVVEAAGGRFTDLDGNRTADGGSAVATNGHLHDEVLAIVAASRG